MEFERHSQRTLQRRRGKSPIVAVGNKTSSINGVDPIVHFPVLLGIGVLIIGCIYDPNGAFEPYGSYNEFTNMNKKAVVWPLPLDVSRSITLLCSRHVILLWGCIAYGLSLEQHAAMTYKLNRRERFAMVWSLMNAFWFHIGCDVFSGLLQIMPNLTEMYKVLNKDHILPVHHPERVVMDCIYWFELLVEAPLALIVFYLFLRQDKRRWVVEAWLHGMHLGGYVGYRAIAFCWVVIPIILTWDTLQRMVKEV